MTLGRRQWCSGRRETWSDLVWSELVGKPCARVPIAHRGRVPALAPKLAFAHLGDQLITNLGKFFYLLVLWGREQKVAKTAWIGEIEPIMGALGLQRHWGGFGSPRTGLKE